MKKSTKVTLAFLSSFASAVMSACDDGGRGYYPGDTAYGGGMDPRPGARYDSPSRVPRGGFGTTGRAFVSRGHIGG